MVWNRRTSVGQHSFGEVIYNVSNPGRESDPESEECNQYGTKMMGRDLGDEDVGKGNEVGFRKPKDDTPTGVETSQTR